MSELSAFITEYFDWANGAQKLPNRVAQVNFRMVTNNRVPNGPHSFASYTEGTLSFEPAKTAGGHLPFLQGARFYSGSVDQLFSDRRYVVKREKFGDTKAPFDPKKPDRIELSIQRSPMLTATAALTAIIKLITWGGQAVQFNLECKAGMLIGAIDNNTICAISFNDKFVADLP